MWWTSAGCNFNMSISKKIFHKLCWSFRLDFHWSLQAGISYMIFAISTHNQSFLFDVTVMGITHRQLLILELLEEFCLCQNLLAQEILHQDFALFKIYLSTFKKIHQILHVHQLIENSGASECQVFFYQSSSSQY